MNQFAGIALIKPKQPQTPKGALKPIHHSPTNNEHKTLYFRQSGTDAYRTEYSGTDIFVDYSSE